MGAELNEAERNEGNRLLLKLAAYLDEQKQETPARWFRLWSNELKGDPSRGELYELSRKIIDMLGNGPGRLPDLYFAHPDGRPDVERTNDYMETIRAVRRFARRSVPPRSYFLR